MALWGKAYTRAKAKARERWKLDVDGLRTLILIQLSTGVALLLVGEWTVSSTWTRIASIAAPLLLYPLTVLWYLPIEVSEIWRESVVERRRLSEALEDAKALQNMPPSQDVAPIANGDRYTIIVAGLNGDIDDNQTRHVVRSLRDFAGISIHRVPDVVAILALGDAAANVRSAQAQARELASRYNGDLVIWGDVLKADGLLDLHISARDDFGSQSGEYLLNSQLRLPTDFDQALAGLLFVVCLTRVLPQMRAARVGAAEELARETNRLRPLLSNNILANEDRLALSRAFSTAALTIFECTGDSSWLFSAMMIVEGPGEATPEEITFHARLWLAAADQMPFLDLTMTALSWLDRAVAACGKPERIHWFLKAWGLRQLSRLQQERAQQEAILESEREAWDAVAAFLPIPPPNDDIAHTKLGSRREAAVTQGDLNLMAEIVADHEKLRPALSPSAVLEHMQALIEYGVEADNARLLAKAKSLGNGLTEMKSVQQSVALAELVRVLDYRSRIPGATLHELRSIEVELDHWKPLSTFNMAMLGIAQAELHLRLAPLVETQIDTSKQLLLAQVGAMFSQKVIHFKDFHVIERLAKRRYDTAKERFEAMRSNDKSAGS